MTVDSLEPYQELENRIAEWSGMPYVVACSSGSSALLLALQALDSPSGTRCIVPEYTFIACPRAVTLAGMEPVFVDCCRDLTMSVSSLLADSYRGGLSVAGLTTEWGDIIAVMPVHVHGRRCNMMAIHRLADKHDLWIVEDLSQAHGVQPHPQTDAAVWSFNRSKIIHGEEGGAIGFRDPAHADKARCLRSQGHTNQPWIHLPGGWNHRMANTQASLILKSLEGIENNLGERRRIEGWYESACPGPWKMPPREVPWVYDIQLTGPGLSSLFYRTVDIKNVVNGLIEVGIPARHAFRPMTEQKEYQSHMTLGCEEAVRVSREVLCLPIQPGVTTEDSVKLAFETINRILR